MDTIRSAHDSVITTDNSVPGLRGELCHELVSPVRGVSAEQYVYNVGPYHYNWHTALEILIVVTVCIEVCVASGVESYEPANVVVINAMPAAPPWPHGRDPQ